jgi:Anti-sigma-K factor rskA
MNETQPQRAGSAEPASPAVEPVRRRTALWRALAGMAVALALACAIIAFEMSEELVSRITSYRHRIATLNKKVDRLKREAAVDEKRLADARQEIVSKDRIKSILLAPDLKKIKLTGTSAAGVATGSVSLSQKMRGAVLIARGLPLPLDGQVYDAWWILKTGPPAKAAEFVSALDGTATAYLDPPPQGSVASECAVTLEASPGGVQPTGDAKLKGKVSVGDERSALAAKRP